MAFSVSSILAPAGSSTALNPFTQTFTGSANVGDYVFVHFVSSGTGTLAAPTDSAGNTYVIQAQASNPSLRTGMAWTRVTKPIIGGVTTVNASTGGTSFKGSAAFVITPQSSDLMLEPDKNAILSSQTTAAPTTGSSGVLVTPFEIAIAFYGWASADTFTETASWTNPQGAGGKMSTTTTVVSAASQVLFPTATTALNPAAALGASVSVGGGIITFRLANVFNARTVKIASPYVGPASLRRQFRPPQVPQYYTPVVAGGTNFSQPLSDSVTATDDQAKTVVLAKADSVTASETPASTTTFHLTINDAVTATDTPVKIIVLNKADSVSATDAPVKAVGKKLADSVTASEARIDSPVKGLADSVTASDANAKAVGKNLGDTVTTADLMTPSLTSAGSLTKSLADSVTVSDAVNKAIVLQKADSVATADHSYQFVNGVLVAPPSGFPKKIFDIEGNVYWRVSTTKYMKL